MIVPGESEFSENSESAEAPGIFCNNGIIVGAAAVIAARERLTMNICSNKYPTAKANGMSHKYRISDETVGTTWSNLGIVEWDNSAISVILRVSTEYCHEVFRHESKSE